MARVIPRKPVNRDTSVGRVRGAVGGVLVQHRNEPLEPNPAAGGRAIHHILMLTAHGVACMRETMQHSAYVSESL